LHVLIDNDKVRQSWFLDVRQITNEITTRTLMISSFKIRRESKQYLFVLAVKISISNIFVHSYDTSFCSVDERKGK